MIPETEGPGPIQFKAGRSTVKLYCDLPLLEALEQIPMRSIHMLVLDRRITSPRETHWARDLLHDHGTLFEGVGAAYFDGCCPECGDLFVPAIDTTTMEDVIWPSCRHKDVEAVPCTMLDLVMDPSMKATHHAIEHGFNYTGIFPLADGIPNIGKWIAALR